MDTKRQSTHLPRTWQGWHQIYPWCKVTACSKSHRALLALIRWGSSPWAVSFHWLNCITLQFWYLPAWPQYCLEASSSCPWLSISLWFCSHLLQEFLQDHRDWCVQNWTPAWISVQLVLKRDSFLALNWPKLPNVWRATCKEVLKCTGLQLGEQSEHLTIPL